jgi:clan AA aspartic protease
VGLTYETFKVLNEDAVAAVRTGMIKPEELRFVSVNFLADTGAQRTFITEEIAEALGLAETGRGRYTRVAGGQRIYCKEMSCVEIIWNDRCTPVFPLIMSGQDQPIIGAIALEAMDLMVDTTKQKVVGVHGDEEIYLCL